MEGPPSRIDTSKQDSLTGLINLTDATMRDLLFCLSLAYLARYVEPS